jgi:hypothetical protein
LKKHGVQLDAVRDWLANLLEERKREANRVLKVPNTKTCGIGEPE